MHTVHMSLCFVLVGYQAIFFGVTSLALEQSHNYGYLKHSDANVKNMNENILWFIESQLNTANQNVRLLD